MKLYSGLGIRRVHSLIRAMTETSRLFLMLAFSSALLISIAGPAQAQTETVLYSFQNNDNVGNPLVQDTQGNLYGTTSQGGAYGWGTVFEVDPTGTYTLLYSFTGGADGKYPSSGLIQDTKGYLYGTTSMGGTYGWGTVFRISPTTGAQHVLYSFAGGEDGLYPHSGLVRDAQGNFYGTTFHGAYGNAGTVFKLTPAGSKTVLYHFTGGADGAEPDNTLVLSRSNLYGTASSGGAYGWGMVFRINPTTGAQRVLYTFTGGADGGYPQGSLVVDPQGNVYGTAALGGAYNLGTVYKVTPTGTETVLYHFTGGADGFRPSTGLIQAPLTQLSLEFYGTNFGGAYSVGTVFQVTSTGSFTTLYTFSGPDGAFPFASLIHDANGNLYGTTGGGGDFGYGTVFMLVP